MVMTVYSWHFTFLRIEIMPSSDGECVYASYTCVCVYVVLYIGVQSIHLNISIIVVYASLYVLLFAIRFLPFFHPYLKCSIATYDSLRFFIIICHFTYINFLYLITTMYPTFNLPFIFFPLTFLIHLAFVFWLGYSVTVSMVWWKRKTSFGHTKRFKR